MAFVFVTPEGVRIADQRVELRLFGFEPLDLLRQPRELTLFIV